MRWLKGQDETIRGQHDETSMQNSMNKGCDGKCRILPHWGGGWIHVFFFLSLVQDLGVEANNESIFGDRPSF